MKEQDIKDFIRFFTHKKNLNHHQVVMRDLLISRDCSPIGITPKGQKSDVVSIHNPKETASFLSLFSNPDGLKYLTHDFDPNTTKKFTEVVSNAVSLLKKYSCLPKSLVALMYAVLTRKSNNGQPNLWIDYNNKKHEENFSCEKWIHWSEMNDGQHPLKNPEIANTIMLFRNTIRVEKPNLRDLFVEIAQPFNLRIEYKNIEKADFYTNVWALRDGLRRIMMDINTHSKNNNRVSVEFSSKFGDDFSRRIIRITHIGSYGGEIEEVKSKFHEGGGTFYGIKERLEGYCNWSVESLWNDKPVRWNILNDAGEEEIEILDSNVLEGFTHILTFYHKLK